MIKSFRLPPGNMGLPVIGETISFLFNPKFSQQRIRKHGSIFKTRLFGSPFIFVSGQDALKFVLTNENNYFIAFPPPSTRELLGQLSISNQIGSIHQNRRRLLAQAFAPRLLQSYSPRMMDITEKYLSKWESLQKITWYKELRKYTFDVACQFLLGLDDAYQGNFGTQFEAWGKGLFSVPIRLRWTNFGKGMIGREELLNQIETIINNNECFNSDCALARLISAKDEEGNSLELEEIKHQILLLLFAGHETLTSALTTLCLMLAQHPEVLARCKKEQNDLGNPKNLNQDILKEMIYLDKVLFEVLRHVPPVGIGFRKCIKDCDFAGFMFPQGWSVFYLVAETQHDSSLYPDPYTFNPDRFTSDQMQDTVKTFAYTPFAGGMRECIGKEFAKLEMKIFAARLIQDYKWEILPKQDLSTKLLPVPHPVDGLKVLFTKA